MQLIFFTINFIIFITGLVFLLRKPVSNYLKDRKTSFVNGHDDAKKYYDDTLNKLNSFKERVRNIDKEGRDHIEDFVDQARAEAKLITLNAETYSKATLVGMEELIKEETERAKNKEVADFIHSIINKTKNDVKKESLQTDYSGNYIKDYFAESKRVEG